MDEAKNLRRAEALPRLARAAPEGALRAEPAGLADAVLSLSAERLHMRGARSRNAHQAAEEPARVRPYRRAPAGPLPQGSAT